MLTCVCWFVPCCRASGELVTKRDGSLGQVNPSRAFIEHERDAEPYRDPMERLSDWGEINSTGRDPQERKIQAARCMGEFHHELELLCMVR